MSHILIIFLSIAAGASAYGDVMTQDIQDLVDVQGSTEGVFFDNPNIRGSGGKNLLVFALPDTFGVINKWLQDNGHPGVGTTIEGTLTVTSLRGGNSKVQAVWTTENAIGFAQNLTLLFENGFQFNSTDTIFGSKPYEILAGADAYVGTAEMDVCFIMKGTDILPDLYCLLGGDCSSVGYDANMYEVLSYSEKYESNVYSGQKLNNFQVFTILENGKRNYTEEITEVVDVP